MKRNGLLQPELQLRTQTLRRSFLREGAEALTLEARLPEAEGAGPLNAYYRRMYHQLAEYCVRELVPALPEQQDALQLLLEYRVRLLTPALLSLTLELHRKGPSSVPAARFAAVWSRKSGFPMGLRAFFPGFPGYRRKLREWLRGEALARLSSGYCLYDPVQVDRAGRLFSPGNFYAAEQGLILFYPPLVLGSAAEGIPEFCLPWNDTGPRLPEN